MNEYKISLVDLLTHVPQELLDAYITERQPKRGESGEDGWMLLVEPGPTLAEDQWVCLVCEGELYNGQMEPPDYGWAVQEHGSTPVEAMARGIVFAMKEIW
jgi:hypothetical protein